MTALEDKTRAFIKCLDEEIAHLDSSSNSGSVEVWSELERFLESALERALRQRGRRLDDVLIENSLAPGIDAYLKLLSEEDSKAQQSPIALQVIRDVGWAEHGSISRLLALRGLLRPDDVLSLEPRISARERLLRARDWLISFFWAEPAPSPEGVYVALSHVHFVEFEHAMEASKGYAETLFQNLLESFSTVSADFDVFFALPESTRLILRVYLSPGQTSFETAITSSLKSLSFEPVAQQAERGHDDATLSRRLFHPLAIGREGVLTRAVEWSEAEGVYLVSPRWVRGRWRLGSHGAPFRAEKDEVVPSLLTEWSSDEASSYPKSLLLADSIDIDVPSTGVDGEDDGQLNFLLRIALRKALHRLAHVVREVRLYLRFRLHHRLTLYFASDGDRHDEVRNELLRSLKQLLELRIAWRGYEFIAPDRETPLFHLRNLAIHHCTQYADGEWLRPGVVYSDDEGAYVLTMRSVWYFDSDEEDVCGPAYGELRPLFETIAISLPPPVELKHDEELNERIEDAVFAVARELARDVRTLSVDLQWPKGRQITLAVRVGDQHRTMVLKALLESLAAHSLLAHYASRMEYVAPRHWDAYISMAKRKIVRCGVDTDEGRLIRVGLTRDSRDPTTYVRHGRASWGADSRRDYLGVVRLEPYGKPWSKDLIEAAVRGALEQLIEKRVRVEVGLRLSTSGQGFLTYFVDGSHLRETGWYLVHYLGEAGVEATPCDLELTNHDRGTPFFLLENGAISRCAERQANAPPSQLKTEEPQPAAKRAIPRPAPKAVTKRPAPKTASSRPAPKTSIERPAQESAAQRPTPKTSIERPTQKSAAKRPTPKTSIERPAQKSAAKGPTPKTATSKPTLKTATSKATPVAESRVQIVATKEAGIAGLSCIRVALEPADGQQPGGEETTTAELALKPLFPTVDIELVQLRGSGELKSQSLLLPFGGAAELFFHLRNASGKETKVVLSVVCTQPELELEDCSIPQFFEVEAAAVPKKQSAPPPAVVPDAPPVTEDQNWSEAISDAAVRRVFEHIAQHGLLNEEQAAAILGGQRKLRKFARRLEEYLLNVPFSVHIENAGGVRTWVKKEK